MWRRRGCATAAAAHGGAAAAQRRQLHAVAARLRNGSGSAARSTRDEEDGVIVEGLAHALEGLAHHVVIKEGGEKAHLYDGDIDDVELGERR
jgi:hypothetical protein